MLEEVFLGKEYTDVYFLKKRTGDHTHRNGLQHPLSTCFCASTGGGPFTREGSDIFFIDLGEAYLVEFLTEKGKALTQNKLFVRGERKGDGPGRGPGEEGREKEAMPRSLSEGIEKKLDQLVETRFWDRVHEKCIGCRACTFLCPTCHCFDIVDEACE